MTDDIAKTVRRVRLTAAWHRDNTGRGPAMLAVLVQDAEELAGVVERQADLIRGLCARVEAQSELLSKRAEK